MLPEYYQCEAANGKYYDVKRMLITYLNVLPSNGQKTRMDWGAVFEGPQIIN